jgi:hypothetical protein
MQLQMILEFPGSNQIAVQSNTEQLLIACIEREKTADAE